MINAFVLASILSLSTYAGGGGTDVGGGDDVIILKDDSVVLADPFYKKPVPTKTNCKMASARDFHPALREELLRAGHILVGFGAERAFDPKGRHRATAEFIQKNVFQEANYCFVDKLPAHDIPAEVNMPDGAQIQPLGYTDGNTTWFVESLFRKLSIRDQALAVIHERLHPIAGQLNHAPIVAMTTGLGLALPIFNAQALGEKPMLTDSQVATLKNLAQAVLDLNLYPYLWKGNSNLVYYNRIAPNGGGLVHVESSIHPTAYVGLGSYVPSSARIAADAVLLNAKLCENYSGALIDRRNEPKGPEAKYVHPKYMEPSDFKILVQPGVRMVDSLIDFCTERFENPYWIIIDRNANLENVYLSHSDKAVLSWRPFDYRIDIGKSAKLKNTQLIGFRGLDIEDSASIKDSSITMSTNTYYLTSWISRTGSELSGIKNWDIYGVKSFLDLGGWPRIEIAAGTKIKFKDPLNCLYEHWKSSKVSGKTVIRSIDELLDLIPKKCK